ncbi:MAG: TolC family protein, partial [Boseongicola sp.]
EADLQTTRQDIKRRADQLRASIQRDAQRLVTLRDLVASAETRLSKFEEQFLSGTVSIEEAVSILETYHRSRDQLAEAQNDLMKAKVEIARTNGQLLPGRG